MNANKLDLKGFASDDIPEQNSTFLVGTFPSNNVDFTTNTTSNAAIAVWHFAQVFFQEFPAYKPSDNRLSIWTESYGGRFGPAFASFFEEQNQKIRNETLGGNHTSIINIDTLGIINGCIDLKLQAPLYPEFARNNTYGIQAIGDAVYQDVLGAWEAYGACADMIDTCRNLASDKDPNNLGIDEETNEACKLASNYCPRNLEVPYIIHSGRSVYDIAAPLANPFPPSYYVGLLSQPWVQEALGVPLNFSDSTTSIWEAFNEVGDYARGGYLEDLASLLDSGVKVALVYGDRDFACNWRGGEAVSLAVPYSDAANFRASGYAEMVINDTYTGGLVRQNGNFSFSLVYQAGHKVPAYQPETAYKIFQRSMNNLDLATGKINTGQGDYTTNGTADVWGFKQIAPSMPEVECYVLDPETCTYDQRVALANGSAVVENYISKEVRYDGAIRGITPLSQPVVRVAD